MKMYKVNVTNEVDYATLMEFDTIGETIGWLDKMLYAVANFSLMSELNDLQQDFSSVGGKVPDKDKFPIRIYNYILSQYNIEIVED